VRIEYRYAEGRPERYPGFFAELLRLNADVIVAGGGTPAARAAKQATSTTPIVIFATDAFAAGSWRAWRGREATSPGFRF
jgi:ABC-type uncharacterized transport system substrate-binding protein